MGFLPHFLTEGRAGVRASIIVEQATWQNCINVIGDSGSHEDGRGVLLGASLGSSALRSINRSIHGACSYLYSTERGFLLGADDDNIRMKRWSFLTSRLATSTRAHRHSTPNLYWSPISRRPFRSSANERAEFGRYGWIFLLHLISRICERGTKKEKNRRPHIMGVTVGI